MNVTYPTITKDPKGNYFITFYLNQKRHRLYSSKKIGGHNHPNKFEDEEQIRRVHMLCAEVYNHFKNGGEFYEKNSPKYKTHKDYLRAAMQKKREGNYSHHYIIFLNHIYTRITQDLGAKNLSSERLNFFLSTYTNPSSYNSVKRHLNALLEGAYSLGLSPKIDYDKKSRKTKAKLHKPIENIKGTLEAIKTFNVNLYLCCIMSYGCLLRPHREIRELRWGDFSDDLRQINLSGERNKSARNRIVPVPSYIRKELKPSNPKYNIFSNCEKPFNRDYFKSLWTKFKRQTTILQPNQTLYSFRHSGALEIFKRTGSIHKLQKAMGHSSIRVSLIYLRGLEVSELKEEDMPMVYGGP